MKSLREMTDSLEEAEADFSKYTEAMTDAAAAKAQDTIPLHAPHSVEARRCKRPGGSGGGRSDARRGNARRIPG